MHDHREPCSDELLDRARTGDSDAIESLLLAHDGLVRAAIDINPKWRPVLETEDVLQITYLEAVLDLGEFSGDAAAFGPWIASIARHNVRDGIRGLERDKRPHPDHRVTAPAGQDSVVWLWNFLTAGMETPSSGANRDEFKSVLESKMSQLPGPYAEVIQLVHFGGKSLRQAAQDMGRTYGAVHLLHQRALDRMRSLLGPASDFFSM